MDQENELFARNDTSNVSQHTERGDSASSPMRSARFTQRITHVIDDIRPSPGSNVMRIYGLSDCVIAVAFTFFVVNIKLPPNGLSEPQLQSFIVNEVLSDLPFYLLSYMLVASSWISHYRIFSYLRRSSSFLIILNIVFLASIVFLPVPVAFFYVYGNQSETWLVFASTQVITSTTLLLMWIVSRTGQMLDQETPPEYLKAITARLVIIPLGCLLSTVIAYFNVLAAEGIFIAFFILGWTFRSLFYRHHHKETPPEGTIRLCSITDNMTAVAITFLIEIVASSLLSNMNQSFSTTLNAVLGELPIYSFSLFVVGLYWLSHHRIFMVIRRHNMTLIWLNFIFLLFIELQPLFNALHASYPASNFTTILYALNQTLTGLMLLAIWVYAATGHWLIDRSMDRSHILFIALRALLIPMIFIFSVAIILFRNEYAVSIWLLVIALEVADLIYRRVRRRTLFREGQMRPEADV